MNSKRRRARQRPAALAELMTVATQLGRDELHVLTALARRLKLGERQYGRLHLVTDRRDFKGKEAREEIEDFLIYFACEWAKAHYRRAA